jgi:hypothetical protein
MDGRIYQGVGRKMIKIETKDGYSDGEIDGKLSTLVTDTYCIVSCVYRQIKADSPIAAEVFRRAIKDIIANEDFDNGVTANVKVEVE